MVAPDTAPGVALTTCGLAPRDDNYLAACVGVRREDNRGERRSKEVDGRTLAAPQKCRTPEHRWGTSSRELSQTMGSPAAILDLPGI